MRRGASRSGIRGIGAIVVMGVVMGVGASCTHSAAPPPPPPPPPTTASVVGSAAASGKRAPIPDEHPDATVESIVLGEVTVAISWSRTAAVFHAVDQLSGWSPFSHKQYAKWAPPPHTAEEDALLEKHAAMRKRSGWEGGLQKAFYLATTSPRRAAGAAKNAGLLTATEAEDESVVLETWSMKLDAHLGTDKVADELRTNLRKEVPAFERLVHRWLAIGDVAPPSSPLPMVIVPSPGQGMGGGGANGGVIVIEVPENSAWATLTTVGHELVHALLRPKWDHFEKAAARCAKPNIDAMTMSEAIVYAMAPGQFAYGGAINQLDSIQAQYAGTTHPYATFSKMAIALKPTIAKMLTRADQGERGMLDELLDASCGAAAGAAGAAANAAAATTGSTP